MSGSSGSKRLENYLESSFEVFPSIASLEIYGIGKLFDDICNIRGTRRREETWGV